MSKQDIIREGIEKEIEDTLEVCGQNPLTAKALAMDTSLDIVKKLHSKGVVIKVDGELPHEFDHYAYSNKSGYITLKEYLKEAGYVAVESLIKE